MSGWHEALLSICPGMRGTAVVTSVILSGCGESGADLASQRCDCKLPQPNAHAATSPVLARGVPLGTITPAGRVGAAFVRHRRQLRHSADGQHGCPDYLAARSPSRTLALLRTDGDDWSGARRLHHLQSGPKRRQASDGTQALEKEGREGLQAIRTMG